MKTTLKLFLTLWAFLPLLGNAQGATLTSMYMDSSQIAVCDTSYYISISSQTADNNSFAYGHFVFDGTNYLGANLTATVDWGDNTTNTYTGTCVSDGVAINWNYPISHFYGAGGIYTVSVTVSDPVSGSSVSSFTDVIMGSCSNIISTIGQLDCDNDGNYETTLQNVPLTISGFNGTNYGIPFNGYNQFYNVIPGDYAVNVDQQWLNNNGYILTGINPDSLTLNMLQGAQTVTISLVCDSTQWNTSQCLDGVVYCDDNNNGIYDPAETLLPNADVTLVLDDGTVLTTTSDATGAYNFSYTGPSLGGGVFLDYTWISSNGYYPTPASGDTLFNLDCTNGTTANLGVICDTSLFSIGCVDGYVFCDDNNNGIMDSSETALSNAPITLIGANGFSVVVYADASGYFSYTGWQLNNTSVTITVDQFWLNQSGFTVTNNGLTLQIVDCANSTPVNLTADCSGSNNCADLWTTVTPWIGYYQNTTNSIYLSWGNNGSFAPGNYTLTLTYPAGVTPVTSSINNASYTISGNTITWTLNSSNNYFYSTDVIYFDVPAGIADSTYHLFQAEITGSAYDCDSLNDVSDLGMYVGVSYDPNDKSVDKPLYVNPDLQETFTYVIRFQNTGTAPAQDVYIMDSLSNNLDWSTLEVVETTHQMQLIDNGNGVIRFDFPQIWLPDSTTNEPLSHGHVVYRIKENANLAVGNAIENTAYIYFDQNAPIITNTTLNVNMVEGLSIAKTSSPDIHMYPNPTRGQLTVATTEAIVSIRVIDLSGKVILNANADSALQQQLDVSDLSKGMYAIEVNTATGTSRSMFIKE